MGLSKKWEDLYSTQVLQARMSTAEKRALTGGEGRRVGSGSILGVIRDILSCKHADQSHARVVSSEKESLLLFCQTFQTEREFSRLPYRQNIHKLFHLLKTKCMCEEWMLGGGEEGEGGGDGDHVRCVLMTLRLLLRDEAYQQLFKKETHPLQTLSKSLSIHAEAYLSGSSHKTDTLKEMTNIFQKLTSGSSCGECVVDGVPEVLTWLVRLLRARDLTLIQCCLCALTNISKSPQGAEVITALSPLPPLLHILQFYDPLSRHMASDLLLLLTSHSEQATLCLKDLDGLSLCLRLLHSDDLHILHRMVCVVERLCEDRELQDDFRLLGGVPLLLALLSRTTETGTSQDRLAALKSASCSAIAQLAINDTNSHHFAQGNGVYLLSKLILPGRGRNADSGLTEGLQRSAWRALRYLYSTERNRRQFRRVFPPKLFEVFIDIGHYVRHSAAYSTLAHLVTAMTPTELSSLQSSIEEANTLRSPLFSVGGYHALELLGSGAFGNVYKVRKRKSDTFLAMKEIKCTTPLLGDTSQDKATSIGKIMNEVNIIKEQLNHPNVVHYHKCFKEGGHLYIIMEMIEGAPLSDHITSLAEKGERFEEDRIWRIFTQLTLALRYLHKEKRVTHRDLKPSNLMLGERDKLTITDFGLAKQKQREFSVMESTVGTLSYWCPELVRSEPYTEKADIWAAGCILYQVTTLQVPFQTTNILALAKKIAEVDYLAIPDGLYSPLLSKVVSRCLTADVSDRPDSVDLGALIAGRLMEEADRLSVSQHSLHHRLEQERQRTLRHQQRYRHLASMTSTCSNHRDGSAGSNHWRISESFTTHPPLITSPTSHSPSITKVTPTHHPHSPNTASEPHPPSQPLGTDWGLTYSPALFHKVSGTGMGSIETGVEWDGDSDISENVFPETPSQQMTSSPGIDRSCHSDASLESAASSVVVKRLRPGRGRSHSAVVPGQVPRSLSGRGHGTNRSQTVSVGSGWDVTITGSPLRHRTPSTSSTLSLTSRHFREISDPITQLLAPLHRLLTLSQLMPTTHAPSSRLLVLDRYQRSLFQPNVSPAQIKGELHRLETRSGEGVWLLEEGEWSVGLRLLQKALMEMSAHSGTLMLSTPPNTTSAIEPCTLTYDLLAAMMDSVHNEQENPT